MDTQISLERLRTMRVPIAWHEAVAIAQHVGRVARLPNVSIGLDNCVLTEAGAVEFLGLSRTPFDRDPAAATLDALLDRGQAPRELVALVDRSAGEPAGDVSSELEFFARPDGAALIAAVATRAVAAAAEEQQQRELERLRAEASAPKRAEASKRKTHPIRRAPRLAVAALAAVVLAIVGTMTLMSTGTSSASSEAAVVESGAEPSSVQQIAGKVEALVDKGLASLGLAPSQPPSPAAEGKPAPAATGRRKPPARTRVAAPSTPLYVVEPKATVDPAGGKGTVEITGEIDSAIDSPLVHDVESGALQRPVLRWPQLPVEPGTQAVAPGAPHLELLINEGGTVDKVRLRSLRNSFHERMLVSAAKAWVFHPAQKDGRPVKYLMRVPIDAQ